MAKYLCSIHFAAQPSACCLRRLGTGWHRMGFDTVIFIIPALSFSGYGFHMF